MRPAPPHHRVDAVHLEGDVVQAWTARQAWNAMLWWSRLQRMKVSSERSLTWKPSALTQKAAAVFLARRVEHQRA